MVEKILDVAAGVLIHPNGQVLLAQRPVDKPWGGWWEFPGGKLEAGETALQAVKRELFEEIGITVTQAIPWVVYVHPYPNRTVRLAFFRVTQWQGEPQGMENQQLCWIDPLAPAIGVHPVLPPTFLPLRWLQLPMVYAISHIGHAKNLEGYLNRLDTALQAGLKLLQLREPGWPDGPDAITLHQALQQILLRCRVKNAKVLINSVHPSAWWHEADGVHLRAQDAELIHQRPTLSAQAWVGASVHNPKEIAQAKTLNVDFAILGSVLPTQSHPEGSILGWENFTKMIQDAGFPIYAVGGQSLNTLNKAWQQAAHGIAGITGIL